MKELNDMQPVCDCLGTWLGQIRARGALDFYDINQVSENTAAELLNLVFKRDFKNLNKERKHFPGIDLGDDTNKEAFQVTSRSDPAKIETDLKTFARNHKDRFPGGIRFLILNKEKPGLSKQKYEAICPGFDPDRDILNDRDLIEEIAKIYQQDKKRFQRIREFLENQFPQGQPKAGVSVKILWQGSKTFYHKLRGPNGRFRYLDISRIIIPGTGAVSHDAKPHPETNEINQKFLRGSRGQFFQKAPPGRRRLFNSMAGESWLGRIVPGNLFFAAPFFLFGSGLAGLRC